MSDILKGLGGAWSFLVSWVLPAALYWTTFAMFILPLASSAPVLREISKTSTPNQSLILAGASILTGLVLNALSTVLYRLLEGYYLPRGRLWNWLKARQVAKCKSQRTTLEKILNADPPDRVAEGLLREKLRRYPADEAQFGPTTFANALRAIETYGWDRFRLDSQTFWSELIAVVPDSLCAEEERARIPINLSVSLLFLSLLTTVTCGLTLIEVGWSSSLAILGLLALILVPVWYRMAILNTRYLAFVVRAMVNLGRVGLAKNLGLAMPATLKDERDMWESLFWAVEEPFDANYERELNSYRESRQRDG